jgi:hypothetical protein
MSMPSKYEEAAKAHFDAIGRPDDGNEMRAWIAGAEHAFKEDAQTIEAFKVKSDKAEAKFDKANKENGSLYAHIEARDQTIKELRESLKTIIKAWQRGDNYEFYEDLIEKHKLL